jgi:hypothetical protein
MRRSIMALMAFSITCCLVGRGDAGFEYHFMPGINGQPLGDVQFLEVAPIVGPASFKVRLSGSTIGSVPNANPNTPRAYLDKWGLGILNPSAGSDRGVQGQVQLDGKNGGEFLRLEFAEAVQLTFLTFSSVGRLDSFQLFADGAQVDLQSMFPGKTGIRSVAMSQGNWPGKIEFTKGSQPMVFAKTWDIRVPSGGSGDGFQLENVGGEVPEPATLVLWGSAIAFVGLTAWRRRKIARSSN